MGKGTQSDEMCCGNLLMWIGIGGIIGFGCMLGYGISYYYYTPTWSPIKAPLQSISIEPVECTGTINTCPCTGRACVGTCNTDCNTTNYKLILRFTVLNKSMIACGKPGTGAVYDCCAPFQGQSMCRSIPVPDDSETCHPIMLSQKDLSIWSNFLSKRSRDSKRADHCVGQIYDLWMNPEKTSISLSNDEKSSKKVALGWDLLRFCAIPLIGGILAIVFACFCLWTT